MPVSGSRALRPVAGAVVRCVAVTTPTLSERADACLATLDEPGRAIARRVLLRLVSFGDGRVEARRHQPLAVVRAGGDPARAAEVVRHLAAAGLLRLDGDEASPEAQAGARIELADASLITAWPTLRAWIDSHGRTEQLRRQLEVDAAAWQHADPARGEVSLLDPGQLGELTGWLTPDARRDLCVSDAAESFVAASRAAARRSWWPGGPSTGTVLAILLMLLILATPIILLFIVVLTAGVIHRLG